MDWRHPITLSTWYKGRLSGPLPASHTMSDSASIRSCARQSQRSSCLQYLDIRILKGNWLEIGNHVSASLSWRRSWCINEILLSMFFRERHGRLIPGLEMHTQLPFNGLKMKSELLLAFRHNNDHMDVSYSCAAFTGKTRSFELTKNPNPSSKHLSFLEIISVFITG